MKSLVLKITVLALILSSFTTKLEGPSHFYGAWTTMATIDGVTYETVRIYAREYYIHSVYESESHKFVSAAGGTWMPEAKGIIHKVEFDSYNPDNVGKEILVPTNEHIQGPISTTSVFLGKKVKLDWVQLDKGESDMFGAWRITERERNGSMSSIQLGARRTIKVLSGTRFQWAAYNIDTKQFMGTGGGTYTAKDGTYTENIEFFSRDDSRVGASLSFNFELKDGNWHHSGLSSKGAPIYEVWSLHKE